VTFKMEDVLNFLDEVQSDSRLARNMNPLDDGGQCLYLDENGFRCIVGYWLHHKAGVRDELFEEVEFQDAGDAIALFEDAGLINFVDYDAVCVLQHMQALADEGGTEWGEVAQAILPYRETLLSEDDIDVLPFLKGWYTQAEKE